MLRRLSVALVASIALWNAGATAAFADDGAPPDVNAVNGEVGGALTIQHPGNSGSDDRESDGSKSTGRSGNDLSDDGPACVKLRLVTGVYDTCHADDDSGQPATQGFTPPTTAEVRVSLHLPDPTPRFGPDPDNNEWKMLVVGYPVWLWTDRPTELSATATHDGLSMTLTAEWTSTDFDMGDGHTVTCTSTTAYPTHPDDYGKPSPTCGYTYQKRSKPGHDFTVTATTNWRVTWATDGRSGTLTTTYAGHRDLTIGELQALIKG